MVESVELRDPLYSRVTDKDVCYSFLSSYSRRGRFAVLSDIFLFLSTLQNQFHFNT